MHVNLKFPYSNEALKALFWMFFLVCNFQGISQKQFFGSEHLSMLRILPDQCFQAFLDYYYDMKHNLQNKPSCLSQYQLLMQYYYRVSFDPVLILPLPV